MRIKEVALIISFKCNSNCQHCFFAEKERNSDELMTAQQVKKYLDDMEENLPQSVLIHGGEPFLFFNKLAKIIKIIQDKNVPIKIITNGFWGSNKIDASKKLDLLKLLSIKEIIISVDSFHQEFILLDYIINILKLARKKKLKNIYVLSEFTPKGIDKKYNKQTKQLLFCLKEFDDVINKFYKFPFMTIGKAVNLINANQIPEKLPNEICSSEGCYGRSFLELDSIDVYPNGDLIICSGFKIGNANKKPIDKIISEFNINNFKVLSLIGKYGTLALLKEMGKRRCKIKKYLNKCHLCFEARKCLKKWYKKELL